MGIKMKDKERGCQLHCNASQPSSFLYLQLENNGSFRTVTKSTSNLRLINAEELLTNLQLTSN